MNWVQVLAKSWDVYPNIVPFMQENCNLKLCTYLKYENFQKGTLIHRYFLSRLEVENKELEQELEDVNKRRKLKHVAAGKEIGEAQKEWKSLLEKNSQIMKASGELDSEIASLQFQLKE